jgi:hypothetical protein
MVMGLSTAMGRLRSRCLTNRRPRKGHVSRDMRDEPTSHMLPPWLPHLEPGGVSRLKAVVVHPPRLEQLVRPPLYMELSIKYLNFQMSLARDLLPSSLAHLEPGGVSRLKAVVVHPPRLEQLVRTLRLLQTRIPIQSVMVTQPSRMPPQRSVMITSNRQFQ